MEFIAQPGAEGSGHNQQTDQKRIQHRIGTSRAGKDEVLVEGGFQYPRIRSTKYRVRLLYVVSDADTGLGFLVRSQAVVQITAQTQIYGPVSLCDRVLHVQGQQLNVRVAVKRKQTSPSRQVERGQSCARICNGVSVGIHTGVPIRVGK